MGIGFAGVAALSSGLAPTAIADSFYLRDGQVIEGSVLKGTLNTLTLQSGSSIRPTPISQIERVVVKLADGSELAGELLSWKDGVMELRSADLVLRVADGVLLSDEADIETTTAAATPAGSDSGDAPVDSFTMTGLPTFTMRSGDILVGKVLHATGSVLTISPTGRSALPISRAQIESVSFETEDGEVASGKLIGWENGTYRLQIDDREVLVNLPDGVSTVSSVAVKLASQQPIVEAAETVVVSEAEQADAAVVPLTNMEQPVKRDEDQRATAEVGAGGPANETAVASLETSESADEGARAAAADVNGQHLIETLVDTVTEGSETVIVKFQLDKPAARPLVVLYAATDSSAKAGEDFEAKSGVITFATGSSYAEVEVPIIDDDLGEDSEEFNLYLSGDPQTIAFSERQVSVTIADND
ncbi:MAG: Calx-beta domain-containing protein [Pseudomonadota bacterium]